ncbi:hypothetical protein SAMN05443248_3468 [Bradyrhizobium erythrophlei]|jgi:hypothetical protein|uniref:Uncharacterized protein n=1 Tax=Bradyrhizobium erythrophlei TaxID=1437360 RepID=A0A1M5PQR9_9BRAD|nr:hypothetical protein SAMN05443248_3468 [Bradyrhizobium erythrophlei]
MTSRRFAPSTSNPDAILLIQRALTTCVGCRTSWRLDKRRGWKHGAPANTECTAQAERTELREIAARRSK